jgi:hypothetical protein
MTYTIVLPKQFAPANMKGNLPEASVGTRRFFVGGTYKSWADAQHFAKKMTDANPGIPIQAVPTFRLREVSR